MSKVVFDAMVILNLSKCGALETVLKALQGSLVVGVLLERHELVKWPAGSKSAGQPFSLEPFVEAGWIERIEMTNAESEQFEQVKSSLRLGDGETEAFVLCANRGWSLATDDKSARRLMSRHNPKVELVHSVDLVERARARGRLPAAVARPLATQLAQLGGGSTTSPVLANNRSVEKDDG